MYETPPPESDAEARSLAEKIRNWKRNGCPNPGEKLEDKLTDTEDEEPETKEKPKKKRGLFGFFKK